MLPCVTIRSQNRSILKCKIISLSLCVCFSIVSYRFFMYDTLFYFVQFPSDTLFLMTKFNVSVSCEEGP